MDGETEAQRRSMSIRNQGSWCSLWCFMPSVARTILEFQKPTLPAWVDMYSFRRNLEIHHSSRGVSLPTPLLILWQTRLPKYIAHSSCRRLIHLGCHLVNYLLCGTKCFPSDSGEHSQLSKPRTEDHNRRWEISGAAEGAHYASFSSSGCVGWFPPTPFRMT